MTQKQIDNLSIKERLQAPTPKFFQKLKVIGLALAAAGGLILTTPVALPAIVITIAGYVTLAGGVITAVSQSTVEN